MTALAWTPSPPVPLSRIAGEESRPHESAFISPQPPPLPQCGRGGRGVRESGLATLIILGLIIAIIGPMTTHAQTDTTAAPLVLPDVADTVSLKKNKKDLGPWPVPRIAVRNSLILPGWGQIYNKSYWKLPLVYGVLGAGIGLAIWQDGEYRKYGDAYSARIDDDPNTVDDLPQFSATALRSLRDGARQNRDLAIILTVIGYTLTAVEAYVDAHLKHFDVSDDLALRIGPALAPAQLAGNPALMPATQTTLGIKLNLSW